jgi:hypothetical protein
MEGLDVGLPQATAAPAEDSDDDCTETDAESDPYMKVNPTFCETSTAPALVTSNGGVNSMLYVPWIDQFAAL